MNFKLEYGIVRISHRSAVVKSTSGMPSTILAKGGYSKKSPPSTISVSGKSRFQKDVPHQVAWNLKNHNHARYAM